MATIPKWDGQVQERALPGARVNVNTPANAFGVDASALGKGFSAAGAAMEAPITKAIHTENKRIAREAYRGAAAEVRDLRKAMKDRRGHNAHGMSEDADKQLQEIQKKYRGQLKNPAQTDLFGARWASLYDATLTGLGSYEQAQLYKADEETSAAIVTGAVDDAVANYTSAKAIRNSWADITLEVEEQAERNGWDAARTKEEKDKILSTMHTKIIDRWALDNPGQAKAYYEKYKDQIDGRLHGDVEAKLKSKIEDNFAQGAADQIVAAFPKSTGFKEAVDYARKHYSGSKEKKLVAELKTRYSDIVTAEKLNREQQMDDTINDILNAGSLKEALAAADSLKEGTERLKATKVAHQMFKQGTPKKNSGNILAADNIRKMVDEGDEQANSPAKVIALAAEGGLTPQQQQGVLEYMQKGGKAGALKRSQLDSVVKDVTGDKDGLKKYPELWDMVIERLPDGVTPTDDSLRKITVQLMTSGEVPGTVFDPDRSYYEALNKGQGESWLPDVTSDEKKQITPILKKAGRRVDLKTIRMYKKHIILGIPKPKKQTPEK